MSYAVVRVQKMTMGSVRGIEIHDRRVKEGISHSNPDIDWLRTGDNYDLHPEQNKNFYRTVKSRIDSLALKRSVRKDAVVMAQVLVTSDTEFFDRLQSQGGDETVRKFFQASYDFLAERYGEENIISSIIHLDERTPHMHFNFVPVTDDGRLCAKEVTARAQIISLHDKFRDAVGRHYGLLRGEPKEAGKRRTHLETAEYKAVMEEVKREQERAVELREDNDDLDAKIEARFKLQEQRFIEADNFKRQEVANARAEAQQIRSSAETDARQLRANAETEAQKIHAAAKAEAAQIIGSAPQERDEAIQERNIATQEATKAVAREEDAKKEINALEGEIRRLRGQQSQWRSSLRSEKQILAVGEEVKSLFGVGGAPYIKCKPDEFAELQKAASNNFAWKTQAEEAEYRAAEAEERAKKMIAPTIHNLAVNNAVAQAVTDAKNEHRKNLRENKAVADERLDYIKEKGLETEFYVWKSRRQVQEQRRSQKGAEGMER